MGDDLINRLRGKYSCGPNGVYEDRDFGNFTPAICKEAADEITRLRAHLAKATELAGDLGEAIGIEIAEGNELQGAIDGLFEMQSQIQEWRQLAEAEGHEPVYVLALRPQFSASRGMFSRAGHLGYTNDLNEAGRFTWAQLEGRADEMPDKYVAIPITHPKPAKVPDEKSIWCVTSYNEVHFNAGWNACRESMLKSQQENEK